MKKNNKNNNEKKIIIKNLGVKLENIVKEYACCRKTQRTGDVVAK